MDETPTQRSAETGELAKALAAAQSIIRAPKKGRTAQIRSEKGNYGYNYADLADVIECCREALAKNELAPTQTLRAENGHMVLVTTLLHSSGQWISSEYPLQNYQRPQEQGSAITYARRYSLSAMLGIAAEDDDDGATAQAAEPVKREPAPVSADAAAVLMLAEEIAELANKPAPLIIREASSFPDKKDPAKTVPGFSDPREPKAAQRPEWVKRTKDTLSKRLAALKDVAAEPGVAEAAEIFR